MSNCTVKLTGGVFTGSGVILTTMDNNNKCGMVIATAAHNLWVYIDGLSGKVKQPFWADKLHDEADAGQLLTDKKDTIINQVTNGTVSPMMVEFKAQDRTGAAPVDANGSARVKKIVLAEWSYDLCLLYVITDQTRYPKAAVYSTAPEVTPAHTLSNQLSTQGTLPNGWRLVQAGYGQTDPDNEESKSFNFKVSAPAAGGNARPRSYFDSLTGQNTSVIKLESTSTWTTLKGDSGGPLFALNTTTGAIVVLGVTLGSDVFATQEAETEAQQEDDSDGAHNNACTWLGRVFDAWGPVDQLAILAQPLFVTTFSF